MILAALPAIIPAAGASSSPLPVWAADIASAAAGTDTAWLQCMGDSITLGGHGTGGSVWGTSYPAVLRDLLETSQSVAIAGPGVINVAPSASDPALNWGRAEHLTYTGTWATVGGTAGVGSSETDAQITFQTVIDARYVTLWYWRISGTNSVEYRMDGGAWTAWTFASGSVAILSREFDFGTVGAHTLDIRRTAGTPVLDSFTTSNGNGLQVHNIGISGAQATGMLNNLLQAGGASFPTVVAQPSLTIIMIGSNDWNTQKALATFKTQVEAQVATVAAGTGDLVIMSPPPPNLAEKPITMASYAAQLEQIATDNDALFIDNHARWQSIDTTGFYVDSLHPTPLGQAEIAQTVHDAITA